MLRLIQPDKPKKLTSVYVVGVGWVKKSKLAKFKFNGKLYIEKYRQRKWKRETE